MEVKVHTSCPVCRDHRKVYRMRGQSILGTVTCPVCVRGQAVLEGVRPIDT